MTALKANSTIKSPRNANETGELYTRRLKLNYRLKYCRLLLNSYAFLETSKRRYLFR